MANVSLDDVRDAINVSATDVPDVEIQKMVKRWKDEEKLKMLIKRLKLDYHSPSFCR